MKYKYIYGPVPSWRLGSSLGVDPVYTGRGKICSFDCNYCQVGKTTLLTDERKIYVPAEEIIKEIKSLPAVEIDYITLSGAGEPTLAANLGEIINEIKKIRDKIKGSSEHLNKKYGPQKNKIAILTNSSLIDRKDLQDEAALADFVIAKLDAHSEKLFAEINKPAEGVKFDNVVRGLKEFRARYKGKMALQIMFMEQNKNYAEEIARLARQINPDEIQINTPLRPCGVKPVSKAEIERIKPFFKGMNYISVYDAVKKTVKPVSKKDTLKRRGKI